MSGLGSRTTARMVCPRCEGQRYDKGSCQMCGNTGYIMAHAYGGFEHAEGTEPECLLCRCAAAEEALRELAGYVRAHLAGNDADPELRYALEQADDALAVVSPEPQDDDFSDDPQAHLQGRGGGGEA